MSRESPALLRTSTEFDDGPASVVPSRDERALRPEGQPPAASRAREQETVSPLVATLATTEGPVLIRLRAAEGH